MKIQFSVYACSIMLVSCLQIAAMDLTNDLFAAIRLNKTTDFTALLETKRDQIDLNFANGCYGTPLLYSMNNRRKNMIEALLKVGVDVNKRDILNVTPLQHAILFGNNDQHTKDVVSLLLKYGADTQVPVRSLIFDKFNGKVPEKIALFKKFRDIALLIQQFDKVKEYKQGVFTAASHGDCHMLKGMVQYVTLHLYDDRGNTPLHRAVLQKQYDMVLLILSINPRLIIVKNDSGQTPVDCAVCYPQSDIFKSFMSLYAPEITKNNNNNN